MYNVNDLLALLTTRGLPSTILLLLMVVLARWVLIRLIDNKTEMPDELKLRWRNMAKNVLFLVAVIGLASIWAPQLENFALSLTAFAVAAVIATKELILCLSGSLLRASSGNFSIGDLIEVLDCYGYVVEQNLMTTEIREVGADGMTPTGRIIVIPNSAFLTSPVKNHSALRPYVSHQCCFTLEPDAELALHVQTRVQRKLDQHWVKLKEDLMKRGASRSRQTLIWTLEPTVRIATTDIAKLQLQISFVVLQDQRRHMERELTQLVLDTMAAHGAASDGQGAASSWENEHAT